MAKPVFSIAGIDHLRWEYVAGGSDARDVILRFAGPKLRTNVKALDIVGIQMSDWHFSECIYNRCDEVRVFDQNQDGAQLEFGRFVVEFLRNGAVAGKHFADSVAVRMAG